MLTELINDMCHAKLVELINAVTLKGIQQTTPLKHNIGMSQIFQSNMIVLWKNARENDQPAL